KKVAAELCKMYGVLSEGEEEESPALVSAASRGQEDMLELLLIAGHDVHCANRDGMTALHAAATMGYDKCIQVLLLHGA
ncbi:hypothetical protein GUITHDRAFT_61492, partial [Guillardia theta CCMP2712]